MTKSAVFENNTWKVYWETPRGGLSRRLVVEGKKTSWVDFPALHNNGRITWGRPERIPEYIQKVASKALHTESVRVGDDVHVGHGAPGGAGIFGRLLEIKGSDVLVEGDLRKDGPFGEYRPKYRGALQNTTLVRRR